MSKSAVVIGLILVGVFTFVWIIRRWAGTQDAGRMAPSSSPKVQATVPSKLAGLKRKAWVPRTEKGDGPVTTSKFSGIPWLSADEAWPACPNCRKPMQLFVQLSLPDLPARPEGCPDRGLVQLFYCTTQEPMCEFDCEAYAPFSKSVLVRIVEPSGSPSAIAASPVPGAFPPRRIVGWDARDDFPNWEEAKERGVELTDEEADADRINGEKLLGWPDWVQGVEYPKCPDCGQRMQLLFQIDSEKNLPYMFGDVGCGHITQCPRHPTRLAFAWACG